MAYRYLADAVLLLHLAFILFVVFGAPLVLRRRRWVPLHLAAAAWGVGIELGGGVCPGVCPLTWLEIWLRRLAGESGYGGGFVEHYLVALIYPAGLGPETQYLLAACVVAVNAGWYACTGFAWMRGSR